MNRADLPRLARELAEAAEAAGGWIVDHPDDDDIIEGANASFSLTFLLPLCSGRAFAFLTRWARSARTDRWQSLKLGSGHRVAGTLLPGDGSSRDVMAEMIGAPLETRHWKALKNLSHWLARPADVAALDWVDDVPGCLCEHRGGDECLCELCVHGDCKTILTECEKEMAFDKDGDEAWPLCGVCVLLYYTEDGESLCTEPQPSREA